MLFLQHGIAGSLGAAALFFGSEDRVTFLFFVRWGMLFEAGWELSDWFFNIIPNIAKGNGLKMIPMIVHHFCLYALLPTNLHAIEGPIGQEVAWSLVLFAGTFLPLAFALLAKECLDDKNPKEKLAGDVIIVALCAMILITRGPMWWHLAYNFITKSAAMGTGLHVLFWVLVIFFQLFNLLFYLMCFGFNWCFENLCKQTCKNQDWKVMKNMFLS